MVSVYLNSAQLKPDQITKGYKDTSGTDFNTRSGGVNRAPMDNLEHINHLAHVALREMSQVIGEQRGNFIVIVQELSCRDI